MKTFIYMRTACCFLWLISLSLMIYNFIHVYLSEQFIFWWIIFCCACIPIFSLRIYPMVGIYMCYCTFVIVKGNAVNIRVLISILYAEFTCLGHVTNGNVAKLHGKYAFAIALIICITTSHVLEIPVFHNIARICNFCHCDISCYNRSEIILNYAFDFYFSVG